jgi:hypothetical protein
MRGSEMDIKNISRKGYACQTVRSKIPVFHIKKGQIHLSGFTLTKISIYCIMMSLNKFRRFARLPALILEPISKIGKSGCIPAENAN